MQIAISHPKTTLRHPLFSNPLFTVLFAALLITLTVVRPHAAYAAQITPPAVPDAIQVPAGNVPYQIGHAMGTQNYICLPSESGVAFKLFTPQATLFDVKGKPRQFATHYFSPNPAENGTIRATWQENDTSMVWAEVKPGNSSTDPNFVAQGAVAWLLLTQVGVQSGPNGGDALTATTYIQRVNTSGGMAPATGCAESADIGKSVFVPYAADYIFYRSANK